MVFVFSIIFIIISIILLIIKIKINNLKFELKNNEHLNDNFKISITIFLLQFIPIFKFNITKKRFKKMNIKSKIGQQVTQKNIKNKMKNQSIKILKILIPDIKQIKLNITFGTKDAAQTAYIFGVLKTILNCIFKKNAQLYPVFKNQNELKIYFEGIFEYKLIHIINKIIIYNRERRRGKNERTSNRKTYAYSHE